MALSDISRSTILAEPTSPVIRNHAAFIWSLADLLRGDYSSVRTTGLIDPRDLLEACFTHSDAAVVVGHHRIASRT
jgi:hypothetical protein